nr:immunoglobulin heavy chain junction region [Macaca mulatta]MOW90822.1 immunoglobulin heavy chain junction region [Macaca mulatta]
CVRDLVGTATTYGYGLDSW